MSLELVRTEDLDARAAEVERQAADARQRAEAIEVRNPEEAEHAGRLLREIAARRKAAKAEHKELKAPILEAGRTLDRKLKEWTAPLDAADEVVRGKLGTYTAEQERIRKEEEARLEAERQERERKAREERERQEAAERAKREQAEREAREAAEEARKAQDAADREAAEKLEAEARQAAEEAKTAEAAIASLPEPTLPKAVVPAAPKIDGVSDTKRWEPEVVDLAAVPTYLPDGEPLIEVRSGPLRRYMHAYIKEHGHPPELAGVRFERVRGQQVRS